MSKPIPKPKPMRKKTPDYQIYNHKDTRIECHKRFNYQNWANVKPLVTFNTRFNYQNWANVIHGNLTGEEERDNSGELVLDEIMKVKIQSLRDNMYELNPQEKENQDQPSKGKICNYCKNKTSINDKIIH